jgi:hypothetical protein
MSSLFDFCVFECALGLSRANQAMNNFVNGVDQIVQSPPPPKSLNNSATNSSRSSRLPSLVSVSLHFTIQFIRLFLLQFTSLYGDCALYLKIQSIFRNCLTMQFPNRILIVYATGANQRCLITSWRQSMFLPLYMQLTYVKALYGFIHQP